MSITHRPSLDPALCLATLLACCAPTLLAYNPPPSPIVLNQCLAVALWGGVAAMTFTAVDAQRKYWAHISVLMSALGVIGAAMVGSWALGNLPPSLALSSLGPLAGAALLVVCGASASHDKGGPAAFGALAIGLLVAGLAGSAVGLVQVFAPEWTDGIWIASSNAAGVATGNVRQPNHLSELLLWALVSAVALHELRWLPRAGLWAAALPMIWVVQLTHSRTGGLSLFVLLIWALLDKRLSVTSRRLLTATPLIYAFAYGGMLWFNNAGQLAPAGGGLPGIGSLSIGEGSSRLTIWQDSITMIAAQPWTGVGFGEWNLAWTLSQFAVRPGEFFDNSHNLLLQLAVELGLPLAALVTTLLMLALWQGLQRASKASGDPGLVARAGSILLIMVLLHSMVEYPLWLGYFLLPTALVWGLVLGVPSEKTETAETEPSPKAKPLLAYWGLGAGFLMSLAGAWSILDYIAVKQIYSRGYTHAELSLRIERGQRSLLFAHFADYTAAANTAGNSDVSIGLGFARAVHRLVDPLLMMNWANRLAAQGDVDRARWIAQRLRDFKRPESEPFFAPCQDADSAAFQCQWPVANHSWREFASPALLAAQINPAELGSPATAAMPISAASQGSNPKP
jgi:O-antigen ligase